MKSPLIPIFLTVLVDVFGYTLMLPVLAYYAEHYGASPFVVTLITASYSLCQLISGPLLGRLSDRIGRKPVLLASQFGSLVGYLVMARADALWMVFLGRIIDGSTAGNLTIAQAYISDVTKPENRTRAFAVIGIAFGFGFLVGPFVSGQLADSYGIAAPMYAAGALSLLSVLTTATMIPKHVERVADPGSPAPPVGRSFAFGTFFSRPASRRVLIEFFCFAFAFATLTGGFTLFLKHGMNYNVKEAGRIWGFSGLIGLIVQGGMIRPLVKRFGDRKLAAIGFFAMTAGYAVLAFAAGSLPILLVSSGFAGFGIAVVRPCITNLLTQTVSRDEQGAVLGVSQSLTSISQVTAHPTAGLLMEAGRSGMVAWALVAAAFALIGFIVRVRPENPASDPAPA